MDEEHKKQGIPIGKRLGLRTKNPRRRKRSAPGGAADGMEDDPESESEEKQAEGPAKRRKE